MPPRFERFGNHLRLTATTIYGDDFLFQSEHCHTNISFEIFYRKRGNKRRVNGVLDLPFFRESELPCGLARHDVTRMTELVLGFRVGNL